jgi:hypothetical protein
MHRLRRAAAALAALAAAVEGDAAGEGRDEDEDDEDGGGSGGSDEDDEDDEDGDDDGDEDDNDDEDDDAPLPSAAPGEEASPALAQALDAAALGVTPLQDRDIEAMLSGIRASALLDEFRGMPPVDRAALAAAIRALFSRMAGA